MQNKNNDTIGFLDPKNPIVDLGSLFLHNKVLFIKRFRFYRNLLLFLLVRYYPYLLFVFFRTLFGRHKLQDCLAKYSEPSHSEST